MTTGSARYTPSNADGAERTAALAENRSRRHEWFQARDDFRRFRARRKRHASPPRRSLAPAGLSVRISIGKPELQRFPGFGGARSVPLSRVSRRAFRRRALRGDDRRGAQDVLEEE